MWPNLCYLAKYPSYKLVQILLKIVWQSLQKHSTWNHLWSGKYISVDSPKETWTRNKNRHLYMDIYCGMHKRQMRDTNPHTYIHTYKQWNSILNDLSSDTCYNVDLSWKCDSEQVSLTQMGKYIWFCLSDVTKNFNSIQMAEWWLPRRGRQKWVGAV